MRPFGPTPSPEIVPLVRSVVIILSVALLSGLLSHLQQAQGERELASASAASPKWIRTVDGWEPSRVLLPESDPALPPVLHPLLVASFQLTASLFALLAFPAARVLAGDRKARRG